MVPSSTALTDRPGRLKICFGSAEDREAIYRARHSVYAEELGQHETNASGTLQDQLDAGNFYLVAKSGATMVGFVSVTPPSAGRYSMDKYVAKQERPFASHDRLFEVRLLTVLHGRGAGIARLLMLAALDAVEELGGTHIMAVGRIELLDLYEDAGLEPTGVQVQSGALSFELLHASTARLRRRAQGYKEQNTAALERVAWPEGAAPIRPAIATQPVGGPERLHPSDLQAPSAAGNGTRGAAARDIAGPARATPPGTQRHGLPSHSQQAAHGGDSFSAIGENFEAFRQRNSVISADVLDAWFDPAPEVVQAVTDHLAWMLKTSPPTAAGGLLAAIAKARGVGLENVLAGGGSSDLIYLGLQRWCTPDARVLIISPSYSEYAYVLGNIGCLVERLVLQPEAGFRLNHDELRVALGRGYDWVILVNPNNPTGDHVAPQFLEEVIGANPETNFWVDETYVEYAGHGQSLEQFAAASSNVIVCKSMSKVYALSGARVGYLCGPATWISELRRVSPPWAVSLVAQVAACAALRAEDYYATCWEETHKLSARLREGLERLGWTVFPSVGNYLLCQMPPNHPTATELVAKAQEHKLYLRDTSGMGALDGLGERLVRIAVKDRSTNQRILATLQQMLSAR